MVQCPCLTRLELGLLHPDIWVTIPVKGVYSHRPQDVSIFVQPSSVNKAAVQQLKAHGYRIVVGDLSGSVEDLVPLLKDIVIIISAVGPEVQHLQIPLIDAAVAAGGIKRFVPCGFTTVCPPSGIMLIRDDKEKVYNHVFRNRLPYTIIDVGFWHQISFPRLPSGKADYATLAPITKIYGDGTAPNLLTDERDIGRYVARIVRDDRTLNKKVVTYSDELSSNQIWELAEKVSGEKIGREFVSILPLRSRGRASRSIELNVSRTVQVPKEEFLQTLDRAQKAYDSAPDAPGNRYSMYINQYHHSKYIRADNTIANAKYLGYLDAKELYPDFEPISFETFLKELMAGKVRKVYADRI